jgi:hypothetical protein
VISAGLIVSDARKPKPYTVTVGLLVSEGPLRTRETREQLGAGALRTHVKNLTFTRARLGELIRSHPADFPGATKDLEGAISELRERIKYEINDVAFDDDDFDAPRSARIALTFTASKPESAWRLSHALADLLIDSTLARQRAALLRERAGAEAALEAAEGQPDLATLPGARSTAERLRATQAGAAQANFGLRAAEEQQAIRFELVDPGRMPTAVTKASLVGDGAVTLAIVLLAAFLLAGAFDPRVIDPDDLVGLGISMLGRLPPLPAAPIWPPAAPRNAPDARA